MRRCSIQTQAAGGGWTTVIGAAVGQRPEPDPDEQHRRPGSPGLERRQPRLRVQPGGPAPPWPARRVRVVFRVVADDTVSLIGWWVDDVSALLLRPPTPPSAPTGLTAAPRPRQGGRSRGARRRTRVAASTHSLVDGEVQPGAAGEHPQPDHDAPGRGPVRGGVRVRPLERRSRGRAPASGSTRPTPRSVRRPHACARTHLFTFTTTVHRLASSRRREGHAGRCSSGASRLARHLGAG